MWLRLCDVCGEEAFHDCEECVHDVCEECVRPCMSCERNYCATCEDFVTCKKCKKKACDFDIKAGGMCSYCTNELPRFEDLVDLPQAKKLKFK